MNGPRLSHRMEYWALRGVIGLLNGVSPATAGASGAALGRLGYRPLGIRRRVVEEQIAASFPDMPPGRVREIARAAYEHLGRTAVEAALLPRLGRADVLNMLEETDGEEELRDAVAEKRGLIIVSGHIGNWEFGGAYLAAYGLDVDVVVRRMANPLFDRYLNSTRERMGIRVVHDADAVRRTPRTIRSGGTVAFLADQGVIGLASSYVPFLGRIAKTPRGPAVFALRLGAPVVFAAAIRRPSGRFLGVFRRIEATRTSDLEHDVETVVHRYTAVLEEWVRRYPEQYFWHHRRWKYQPEAAEVGAT